MQNALLLHSSLTPQLFFLIAAILGLLVGSFLNVVIARLPKMMEAEWQAQCAELRGEEIDHKALRFNLAYPPSRCPKCGHQISPLENIPVLSYLVLRGACRGCKTPIAMRYPLVELLTSVLSAGVAAHFGPTWQAVGALLLVWALIALTFIDFDTQLLPDSITLPLMWLGLLFNLWQTYVPLSTAVIGAMAGYLSLWSVYWLFKLATGKEGMGYGDFKLLAALGAWLGWVMLPAIILLSSLVGAVIGVGLIVLARRGREVPMPFGPYLAIAGLIALFWGNDIVRMYLYSV